MGNDPENKTDIWISKSKFFLVRTLIYFSFLLIPILLPKSLYLNKELQAVFMLFYILFMLSQWFFLGKEIDHRFNIYFQIDSSIERIIYRIFMGKFFFIIYFNLIFFLPPKWVDNVFWSTWGILGLFYSWPTRGKIIRESISSNFLEFKYLDRFEKTMIGLILVIFFVSFPGIPQINTENELILFFDPSNTISAYFWSFLKVNYFPFYRYPDLFKIAWSMHFYFVGIGLFLFSFYVFLRLFFSRQLSLLGLFAFLSSWSFYEILQSNHGMSYQSTYSLLWVWSLVWIVKSLSYKTGFFLGFLGFYGCLISRSWILLPFIQLILIYFLFLKNSTIWFKRQLAKYAFVGISLCFLIAATQLEFFFQPLIIKWDYINEIKEILNRKGFLFISFLGIGTLSTRYIFSHKEYLINFKINNFQLKQFIIAVLILFFYSLFFDPGLVKGFSIIWILVFLSLIPPELIFQKINRKRSSRNMIYLIYTLICLLDSHFEERVKNLLNL